MNMVHMCHPNLRMKLYGGDSQSLFHIKIIMDNILDKHKIHAIVVNYLVYTVVSQIITLSNLKFRSKRFHVHCYTRLNDFVYIIADSRLETDL